MEKREQSNVSEKGANHFRTLLNKCASLKNDKLLSFFLILRRKKARVTNVSEKLAKRILGGAPRWRK